MPDDKVYHVTDGAMNAIARGEEVGELHLIDLAPKTVDGRRYLGLYAEPDLWGLILDALTIAGDHTHHQVYRDLASGIATILGFVPKEQSRG